MLDHAGLKTNEEKRKGFTTNFGYRQSRRVLASSSSMDLYVEQASTYLAYKSFLKVLLDTFIIK